MYYSFTLFTNYFQLEEDHDQKLFQLLESQGLAPYSLVTSPLSSFSYVYAKSEHQDCFGSLNRPSARRHHVGTNKTTIQILKNMQIINFQDLVSVIIKSCTICQKALEATVNNFEGKIPKFNLQGTRDHHSVVYMDLLNEIKLLSYKG